MKKAERNDLMERMIKVRKKLPTQYTSIYQYKFGNLSPEELEKVRNVYLCRVMDETIVKNFETIVRTSKLLA